mmetsp:Transcript_113025/g.315839  ORF Transcript_113025/g.315839 Transcript_113025/m.315839 type:complete len:204 (-) Transcript_113025:10-621(-)
MVAHRHVAIQADMPTENAHDLHPRALQVLVHILRASVHSLHQLVVGNGRVGKQLVRRLLNFEQGLWDLPPVVVCHGHVQAPVVEATLVLVRTTANGAVKQRQVLEEEPGHHVQRKQPNPLAVCRLRRPANSGEQAEDRVRVDGMAQRILVGPKPGRGLLLGTLSGLPRVQRHCQRRCTRRAARCARHGSFCRFGAKATRGQHT